MTQMAITLEKRSALFSLTEYHKTVLKWAERNKPTQFL